MKNKFLIVLSALITISATAQDLPQPSPLGKVEQMVGLTTINLEYSRPGVKDRNVFGDLVKMNEIWRFGANACTKITNEHSLFFGTDELKPGSYAILCTPTEKEWTLHFNSDTELRGTSNYDAAKNVVSAKGMVKENSFNETFTLEFNNVNYNSASLTVKWQNVRVDFNFTINTVEIAEKNIQSAIEKGEDLDKVYARAGNFYLKSVHDYKKAEEYADKAIKVKETYSTLFLKAEVLYAKGDLESAKKMGNKAMALAKEAESEGWMRHISDTMSSWK